jgi:Tfp pilus assembly protein PilV
LHRPHALLHWVARSSRKPRLCRASRHTTCFMVGMNVMLRRHSEAGFSLAEVLVAAGIGLVSMNAAYLLNAQHLKMVKSARQSNAGTLALQERVEQLRIATWRQITDPVYLTTSFFPNTPKSVAALDGVCETVTITAFPDATAAASLKVERRLGVTTVLRSGSGLADERVARVDFQLEWKGADERARSREVSTIITNGGVSRYNLPAMGSAAGSPASPASTPTSTPSPNSTPANGATPTPTPPANGSGNGNGRGNVGGNSGKK